MTSKYNSIIILGPTGSGKTELSIMLAKKFNGEVINADSMQIYKYFNIGTAKPSLEEQSGIKHHLLDFLDPKENFSVSDYKQKCLKICEKLINDKKLPIIVGGTGFYIDSLTSNYSYGNAPKDESIRKKYQDLYEEFGSDYLFDLLKKVDEKTANKLHKNDVKRVIRALEINEISKENKSSINEKDGLKEEPIFLKPLIIGLNYERQELYDRINKRVDIMLQNGLIDEVLNLYKTYDKSLQAMKGIGYKELFAYFDGEISMEEAIEKIKQNSRNYAKRQITWFKRNQNIIWFNKSNIQVHEIFNKILEIFNEKSTK